MIDQYLDGCFQEFKKLYRKVKIFSLKVYQTLSLLEQDSVQIE